MQRSPDHMPVHRDDLDGLITWAIIRTARGFEQMLSDVLAPLSLTPVQFGALAHLSIATSLTQAQLAERVLMRPQSANHLLDVLNERGLVERTGERGSGRANPVRLTTAGRRLLKSAWPMVVAANDPSVIGINASQLDQLRGLVDLLLREQLTSSGRPAPPTG